MIKITTFFIYSSISLFIMWQTLAALILKFDAAERTPNFLVAISLILILFDKKERLPALLKMIGIWWGYLLIACFFVGSNLIIFKTENQLIILMFFRFLFCCVFACQWKQNPKTTALVASGSLFAALVLNVFYGETVLFEDQFERLSTAINGNEIALFGCVAILCIVYIYRELSMREVVWSFVICFAVIIMQFMLASRTAILMCLFLTVSHLFLNPNKQSILMLALGSILFFIILFFFLFDKGLDFFSESTIVQRFMYQSEEVELSSLDNTFLNTLFGERAVYWYKGWDLFLEYPILGCGYCNYVVYNGIRCHNEWISQLCEGGIIGFILLLNVFKCTFNGILSIQSDATKRHLLMICMITLIAMGLGLFITTLVPFWVIVGLISAEIDLEKEKSTNNESTFNQINVPIEEKK